MALLLPGPVVSTAKFPCVCSFEVSSVSANNGNQKFTCQEGAGATLCERPGTGGEVHTQHRAPTPSSPPAESPPIPLPAPTPTLPRAQASPLTTSLPEPWVSHLQPSQAILLLEDRTPDSQKSCSGRSDPRPLHTRLPTSQIPELDGKQITPK